MDILKKIWFYSFKVEKKNVSSLVVNLIVWVVAAFAAGLILGLTSFITGWIPVVGILVALVLGVVGGVIELYSLIGIVLSVLVYLDVLKD